jgi:putative ABC transport system substrate-binding protein
MRRRDFLAVLGSAVAWPLAARGQQLVTPVIGFLFAGSQEANVYDQVFRKGLSEMGFVEPRNVAIEYHYAGDQYDRLPALAADLVRRHVGVIAAPGNTAAALAAKAATTTIPIVFTVAVDPVAAGLVASLNRPGGNVTGVTTLNVEIGPKRLEVLHELVPTETSMGLLVNPSNPALAEPLSRDAQAAARALGLQLHVLHASSEPDFDSVFASLSKLGVGALVIAPDQFFNSRTGQLAALTIRYAVPAIYEYREFAAAGGLASYGPSRTESYNQSGVYVGRILKGEKPADLPVMQATKFDLIINLKTAKALGITMSLPLLGRADEVIE